MMVGIIQCVFPRGLVRAQPNNKVYLTLFDLSGDLSGTSVKEVMLNLSTQFSPICEVILGTHEIPLMEAAGRQCKFA